MPWIRVDDHFNEHPKLAQVGPLGWGYWVAGLAYCNRNLTDGFIPRASAQSLGVFEVCSGEVRYDIGVTSGMHGADVTAKFVIGLLVDAGLWYEVEGGYEVHDYLEHQPSKAKILGERDKAKVRVRKNRSPEVRPNTERTSPDVRSLRSKKEEPKTEEAKASLSAAPTEQVLPSQDVVELCQLLADWIRRNDPKAKPVIGAKWFTDMRLLVSDRNDDVAEIARIINWCQSDPFWRCNILSPAKLRKQFSQLLMKADTPAANVRSLPVGMRGQLAGQEEGDRARDNDMAAAWVCGPEALALAREGRPWRHLLNSESEGAA